MCAGIRKSVQRLVSNLSHIKYNYWIIHIALYFDLSGTIEQKLPDFIVLDTSLGNIFSTVCSFPIAPWIIPSFYHWENLLEWIKLYAVLRNNCLVMTFSKNESVRSLNGKNGCYWDTLKKKKKKIPVWPSVLNQKTGLLSKSSGYRFGFKVMGCPWIYL